MKNPSRSDSTRERRVGWFTTIALKDALAREGCAVCQALNTSVRRYIFSFLYEGMMSGDARERFLHGGGLCCQHFRQAKAIEDESWSDGFGIAILCENLLERFSKDVELMEKSGNGSKRRFLGVRRGEAIFYLYPGKGCTVCALARESEAHYLEALEELLSEPEFTSCYERSRGLCLGHVQAAAQTWTLPASMDVVREVAGRHVRQLISELREFQRKHDYQYKHEPRGEEWSAPQRAIEFLTGNHCVLEATGTKPEVSS